MPKDPYRTSTTAESRMGTPAGMGQVVPFPARDRCSPVAVGVQAGHVVPFPVLQSLNNRWDRAVADIGISEGATDAQLRDVFLLMVAEMSGMVVPRKGGGRYY